MDKKDSVNFLNDSIKDASIIPYPLHLKRSDLAESIVAKGQLAFVKGDIQTGLNCFEEALKLDPTNARLYYAQGLSLYEYSEKHGNFPLLSQANKKLKQATLLDNQSLDYWQVWASILYKQGIQTKKIEYFNKALEKIEKAIHLAVSHSQELQAELKWELGKIYLRLAEYSGEPVDLCHAVQAFQTAENLYKQLPNEFWKDYGLAYYTFGQKINDISSILKSISCIKHCLVTLPTSSENWALLAEMFRSLYAFTHEEEHFAHAQACFDTATRLQPENSALWLNWARFLCRSYRQIPDMKLLQSCIEKCEKVVSYDPENFLVQGIWAEALSMLGCENDRLDLIWNAQTKVSTILDKHPPTVELLYSYSCVLKAFGRYFDDWDYYYQAIEKLQEGLSIDRTYHANWYAMGQLYSLLGELEHDPSLIKRSLRFYRKATALNPQTIYIAEQAIALYKLGEQLEEDAYLEQAQVQFQRVLNMHKNAFYLHPQWLFYYACTLDALGNTYEDDACYLKAIEMFTHVLMLEPQLYVTHHRLALSLSHLGELTQDIELFFRAIHHIRLCAKQTSENDALLLDWAIILMNIAYRKEFTEAQACYQEAEYKLWQAIQLGNPHGYYHLACLYCLTHRSDKAMQCLYRGAHFDILPSVDEMLLDEWLIHLRSTGEFIEFLARIEQGDRFTDS